MADFTPLGQMIEDFRQKVLADQPTGSAAFEIVKAVAAADKEAFTPNDAGEVEQIDPPAYCIACDAPRGFCDCGARFYHESWFEYQTAPGSGKILPQYRDWFERNDHGFDKEGQIKAEPKARPLDAIRRELVPWVYLDDSLDSRLEAAYELNPHQVSLLSADLRRGLESGRIASPAGALANALKKIKPLDAAT